MDLSAPGGSEPGFRRPAVVIQSDPVNRSKIRTTIVCILTTNLRLGAAPGNLTLDKGEANLPCRGVVNVTQILTLDKAQLSEKIGTLSRKRLREVLGGVYIILSPSDVSG